MGSSCMWWYALFYVCCGVCCGRGHGICQLGIEGRLFLLGVGMIPFGHKLVEYSVLSRF